MKRNKLLKLIGFLIAVIPFTGVACAKHDPLSFSTRPNNGPKYLLTGTIDSSLSENDSIFNYYSIDNGTAYAVALKTTLTTSNAAITIPDEKGGIPVTGIWRNGFYNSHATSISIPSSITVIDYEAFMGSHVNIVTIPASVNAIGEAAFYYCKNLTKVTFQNSTTSSDSSSACSCSEVIDDGSSPQARTYSTLKVIPSFCFFNCYSLKELMLPESIEEVEYEAFNGCKSLFTTLAFANIKAIRSRAFQGCTSLKTVYISSSFFTKDSNNKVIGVMEDKAFDNCNANLKFYLVGTNANITEWIQTVGNENWNRKDEYSAPGNQINPGAASSDNRYYYNISNADVSYSNDWIYTVTYNSVTQENDVNIESYIGPDEVDNQPVKYLTLPNELPSGSGHYVRSISASFLNSSAVKASIERIYLPTTLKRIENSQFDSGFDNLSIVDDNTKCSTDLGLGNQQLTPRIILNGLTSLEVIGNKAFTEMDKLATIKKLYLPSSLKAVGTNAFGTSGTAAYQMHAVTDFRWEYDDANPALKVIGRGAFYGLGSASNKKNYTESPVHQGYLNSSGEENYKLTTLVFPRTFEHFGITATDKNTYGLDANEANDVNFGICAFAGCPLLSTVIFRGSNTSSETYNLAIPSQTFAMNESLRTVVFEERKDKTIVFHTAGNKFQPAIGWSSGYKNNDFGGDPALQTLVLPNKDTKLYMQNFAFAGNSRGAIYLSASENNKMYGYDTATLPNHKDVPSVSFPTGSTSITGGNYKLWRTIGDESYNSTSNVYSGYCFAASTSDNPNSTHNTYGINQKMPIYDNVHYKKTFTIYDDVTITVEVGSGNTKEYVEKDHCSFVTGTDTGKATMTNYLYDRYREYDANDSTSFNGTAIVPATVTDANNNSYTVSVIGPSAFSAAYCDTTSYANDTLHKDLTAVLVPDSIETIGEYAFMRAYGVTNLYSYSSNPASTNGDYVMPSSLTFIGKHAFAFCNIAQFLKIPNSCLFYENKNAANGEVITSVFSDNYALRKITFGSNSETSSTYYTTTTYTHFGSSTVYTSAIYSTASATRNKPALLLVLNRDSKDYHQASQDLSDVQVEVRTSDDPVTTENRTYNQFNGEYVNGGKFLYGAFKMCYWLDSLIVGTTINTKTVDNVVTPVEQPLISSVSKNQKIYLNKAYNFTENTPELKTIVYNNAGFGMTPSYAFEGCDKLQTIRLPRIENGFIPKGLFSLISSQDVRFEVPSDNTGTNFKTCAKGVLDLQYTAYSRIEKEAFKGTNINTVIAPASTQNSPDFTIEEDAFGSCSSLTLIDFQYVTGTVYLNGSFRNSTIPDGSNGQNATFNYGSSANIEFGTETFKGCTFTNKKFVFPANTKLIGTSCFESCTSLEEVTADANFSATNLRSVTSDNGSGQNNNCGDTLASGVAWPTSFKQIGDYAFFLCTNLKKFDFAKFAGIERIGHYAFSMASVSGTSVVTDTQGSKNNNNSQICENGIIDLPASITNLGVGVFHSSKIVSVTINSANMKFERGGLYTDSTRAKQNKGGHQFRWCTELTTVYFSDPDCNFSVVAYLTANENKTSGTEPYQPNPGGDQSNYFSNCGKLDVVFIPASYNIQFYGNPPQNKDDRTIRPDSMIYKSNSTAKVYLYHSIKDCDLSKPFCVYWHRIEGGGNYDNEYYHVNDINDIINVNNNNAYWLSGLRYWGTLDDGVTIVELGKAQSVITYTNPDKTIVVFNGYYVDSTGIHAGTYVHQNNP